MHRDANGIEEPLSDNPPDDGGQSEIDSYFFKKHAPALSRVLSYVEGDVNDLYLDNEAFASFIYYCLSTTVKKGTWRVGRNKRLVSHLFTPYDEALALLILENNCVGLRDIVTNGPPTDKKKKIKTKYTCKGQFKKGGDGGRLKKADGGRGWIKAGMRRFVDLTKIVEESRARQHRMAMELQIKQSYVIKRATTTGGDEGDDADDYDDDSDSEPVIVCTGIPI